LLRRKTLTSQVIDYILNLIKSGQVGPGDRLPTETELTARLGVSRTCVREAMKSLESLGLVHIKQRVGATVLEPSPANLLNAEQFSMTIQNQQTDSLLEFRKIMEVGLASLAAEKADEADLAAMKLALENYRRELAENRVDCHTDMSFHAALAAASKNPIAVTVWQMISARLSDVLTRAAVLPHVCEETLHDHLLIYRAVRSRNPRRARQAMRAHLENADRVWHIALQQMAAEEEPSKAGRAQGTGRRTRAAVPVAIPR
jgi:GntR family transcriptional repressor for pyruvate dehydrogenase complex